MYAQHAPRIQRGCLRSRECFIDAVAFVLLSIQQPFERVPAMLADVRERGAESQHLWGMKQDGYLAARRKARYLLDVTRAEMSAGAAGWREAVLLEYVEQIPGLGLVKAGFLLQLVVGEGGCLDTHNMRRFGLKRSAFNFGANATRALREHKARSYLDTVDTLCGGCAALWDSWCEYVAALRPAKFPGGAEEVSALHLVVLEG